MSQCCKTNNNNNNNNKMISSEDSDSPAVYGALFPSSGVPSGIVG